MYNLLYEEIQLKYIFVKSSIEMHRGFGDKQYTLKINFIEQCVKFSPQHLKTYRNGYDNLR